MADLLEHVRDEQDRNVGGAPVPGEGWQGQVKLVDPAGEMLEHEWEGVATKLANCPDTELSAELTNIVTRYSIDTDVL